MNLFESQHLVVSENFETANAVWLPSFDELLAIAPIFQISFSLLTDFIHRRRFAEGREREGFYQLLIEKLK